MGWVGSANNMKWVDGLNWVGCEFDGLVWVGLIKMDVHV